METDRAAVLILRAAARGVVDFRKAKLQDPAWYRYVNAVLIRMDADDEMTTLNSVLSYQCALVGNSMLTEESFKATQERCRELLTRIMNCANPWSQTSVENAKKHEISNLMEMYRKLVGDPRDPAFAAKLRQDAAQQAAERAKIATESDEERVDRLLRERQAKYNRTHA